METIKNDLSNRMKDFYERASRTILPRRMPVILRVDGRAFHSYARGCKKPFDNNLIYAMNECAIALCKDIQGAQLAYVQSDEISVLIHSYKRLNSDAWFGNQVQKMCSVAASIASSTMTAESVRVFNRVKRAQFDARVFVLPEAEVCNYFLGRQQDWTRNSVQMLARSLYSHKDCEHKNNSQLQEMIHDKGENWNNLPAYLRRGRCVVYSPEYIKLETIQDTTPHCPVNFKWRVDNDIPIFSQYRGYINKLLAVNEE